MGYFKHIFGQWVIEGNDDTDSPDFGYEIYNPGPNGEKRFYRASPGKYWEPLLDPEPELAFNVPENFTFVNAKGEVIVPGEKISGIICQDGPRLSLTNAQKQGITIKVNDDGSIQVGEEKWWLTTLFQKDKNRIRNYDAYCVREKSETVRVLELGDLNLF